MAKQKYYAVRKGKKTGIFLSWPECQESIKGFSGAVYKSFGTMEEAEEYMNGLLEDSESDGMDKLAAVYAFTDGSFNASTKVYGFGGFLHYSDTEDDVQIRGNGDDEEHASTRNVAGEVHGAVAAMKKAIELGLTEMTLYYDYEGVMQWPTKGWAAKSPISTYYVKEYEEISKVLNVKFKHVKAHTGIPGNELADRMAKEEVGLL